ncbi:MULTISPECIES: S8 family serine peptidase [unclassified Martelella]|uniref:S8 family serine peptidase n=1 Tax=unclassified Martelella TaxID=2629616 RepID=UPI0025BC4DB0|nr:S8 family serine peptidase [Martelella sp.]
MPITPAFPRPRLSGRFGTVAVSAMLASTLLATGAFARADDLPSRPVEESEALADQSSEAVRAALQEAIAFGRKSLLASIVENARLTPERADLIEAEARRLRPDLAASISKAVASGRHLASLFPEASVSGTVRTQPRASSPAARATPYPGGNPSIPKDALSEYQRNYSLDAMHVDAALEKGFTGKGVVVGVIDTGIALSPNGTVHPEFEGRVDPRSKSYLYWFDPSVEGEHLTQEQFEAAFEQGPDDPYDIDGHGTHVSGIIGAGRNGFGMEGVASQATILSVGAIPGGDGEVFVDGEDFDIDDLQYCGPSLLNGTCEPITGSRVPDTVGFEYLSQFSDVKVINGSFGSNAEPDQKTWDIPVGAQAQFMADAKAMKQSLDAGQIIVMSAGNEFLEAPVLAENPFSSGLFPFIQPKNEAATNSSGSLVYDDHGTGLDLSFTSAEALAAAEKQDGIARGRIVVVVALDAYNQISSYSNRCGVAKEWCIAAPGGDQPSGADSGIYSTVPEDLVPSGYDSYSGTSMAAPNVSGAVAVLTEAYPSFTPAEIVEILFMTAEDLGAAGIDAVYGWGLVRLDRALSVGPVGMTGEGVYTVGADGSDTTWIVSFTSDGSLEKQGGGTLSILNAATFRQGAGVEGGLLAVDGDLTTPELHVGRNGTLGGTGRVVADVDVDGTLAPGQSPGTMTIAGNVRLAPTATMEIDVDGTGTENGAGNYDRLLVAGTGNDFAANGTLQPRLRGISGAATNAFTPMPGELFTFVQVADGSVTGSFASLDQPDAGLAPGTRFDVLYAADALSLAATPERYADLSVFGISATQNEKALGTAIDRSRPPAGVRPGAAYNESFNALYAADIEALAGGLSSLTGQIHAEMGTSAVRAIGRFADRIGERQIGLATGWLSETGTPYGTGEVWVSGNHAHTDVASSGAISGYDVNANNGAFGIDWHFGQTIAGVAGSYEYADISAKANGDGNIGTYQAAAYATFETAGPTVAVRGGLSYGDLSTSRLTTLGKYAAMANASGHGMGGFAEVSAFQDFEMAALTLTPSATLGYRGFHRDAMTETGSLFALSLPDETFSETQTTLALSASHRFVFDNGLKLEPVLSAGWRHDFGDLDRSSSLAIFGSGFDASGADTGRNAFIGRVSVNAIASDRFTFGASYEAELRDNLTSQTFSANASLKF